MLESSTRGPSLTAFYDLKLNLSIEQIKWSDLSPVGMIKKHVGVLLFGLIGVFGFQPHVLAKSTIKPNGKAPNILLIYVDDLGYGDLASYGNKWIETPNLDQLAKQGMSFTQAYAPAPLCSPSRAALLTGKEVARLGFEFVTKFPKDEYTWSDQAWIDKFKGLPLIPPPYTLNLPLEEETIAETLKGQGYETALVGKWHVAAHNKVYKGWSETHGPKQQGFDWAYETFGTHPYSKKEQEIQVKDGVYPRDELTEKTIEFLKLPHRSPFFLMSSFYFVHTPLKKNIPWLYSKYQKQLPKETSEDVIHYAVNVDLMDHYIGEILQAVRKAGIEESTMVVFSSDNGGNPDVADNGGFRGSKWNLYEGGIRIPMIVSWPGQIKGGISSDEMVSQLDFMPTFMDVAGGPAKSKAWDGQSLTPLLLGKGKWNQNRTLSWNFPYYHPEGDEYLKTPDVIGINDGHKTQTKPHAAWRKGKYKLVYYYENQKAELYDLEKDPAESQNLGEIQPAVRDQLFKELQNHFKKVNARSPKTEKEIKAENQPTKTDKKMDSGKVPGTIIAHIPQSSKKYIGSPSIAILSDGSYLASHDIFGPESNEHVKATSKIYHSKNKGKNWEQVATINGAFWSKLFTHKGAVYFLGTDRHHGNTIIRKSIDGGKNWTNPTTSETGLILEGEYHCAPMPVIEHNGRIYRAMESAMGPIKKWGKRYGAMMLSAPIDSDLLKADSWTTSNVLYYDSTYLDGKFGGWLEGNAVVGPDGQLWDMLRVDVAGTQQEKAAMVKISNDGQTATFSEEDGFIPFDGGSKKFTILYDEKSKNYWTIANHVPETVKADNPDRKPSSIRNTQALFSSSDLKTWKLEKMLLQHEDIIKHGFQYVDFLFEGKDIIFVSRTAYDDGLDGARNNHDANYLTFHRIKNFRKLLK